MLDPAVATGRPLPRPYREDDVELAFLDAFREAQHATDSSTLRTALTRLAGFSVWWASTLDEPAQPPGNPQ